MEFNSRPVSVLLVDDDEINNFISIKLIKKALLNTEIMACLNGKFAIDQLVEIQRNDPAKDRTFKTRQHGGHHPRGESDTHRLV